jgi:hypothetical protein
MFKRRVHRLATTVFVVFALLFSQLALANYVCPTAAAEAEDMGAMEMAPGEPCAGMDMAQDQAQPVLCHQHCTNAPQTFDPVQLPTVSLPAVVQVLLVPVLQDPAAAESSAYADPGEARPPPDPLFLSTLRLRV